MVKNYDPDKVELRFGDLAILSNKTDEWFVLDHYFKDKYNPTQEEIDMFFMISGIQIEREEK